MIHETIHFPASYSISSLEEFIHAFYKKNDYVSKMYINNPEHGTYTYHYHVKDIHQEEDRNAYMTLNPIRFIKASDGKWNIARDKEHVAALKWLYADLDTYNTSLTNAQVLLCLQEEYFGKVIPHPTLIIDSGRGMYLLWLIDESKLAYNRWVRVQRFLHNTLKEFGSDGAVTSDSARVFRLIGSTNSKSGRKVTVLESNNYRYTLYSIMQEYMTLEEKKTVPAQKNHTSEKKLIPFQMYYSHIKNRLTDLETLLLRHRDFLGSGRENILFLYRYWQCCITGEPKEALRKTLLINKKLQYPLPEKELILATRSAEKGYLSGERYKYKTQTIVDFLNISCTEMRDMKCLVSGKVKAEAKRQKQRSNYAQKLKSKGEKTKKQKIRERVYEIERLIIAGDNVEQICKKLKISTATYYRAYSIVQRRILTRFRSRMRRLLSEKKTSPNAQSAPVRGVFSKILPRIIKYVVPSTSLDRKRRVIRCVFQADLPLQRLLSMFITRKEYYLWEYISQLIS